MKIHNRFFLGLIAVSLLATGFAVAQVPSLFITAPTGTEIFNVQGAGPQIENVYLTQLRDTSGYQKIVPLTGQTLQIPNNISVVQMTPAGGLTALTLTTPTTPFDGQRVLIFTTQSITTFNLTAASGQTVNGNLAGSFSANADVEYLYSLSNKTWDRIS